MIVVAADIKKKRDRCCVPSDRCTQHHPWISLVLSPKTEMESGQPGIIEDWGTQQHQRDAIRKTQTI